MRKIFESDELLANKIAEEMEEHLNNDEKPVFCLASGATPTKAYHKFSERVVDNPKLKSLKIVSLDEWVGIDRASEGSCYQMLKQDIFSSLKLNESQIEFFDGTAKDLHSECQRIDNFILKNPITFSLMGVGVNGHIGLNEPGCSALDYSSIVKLSEKTKQVAQKYFSEPTHLKDGITLGLKQIINSKKVVVVMTGERKAEIAQKIFNCPDEKLPAQQLMGYDHITFLLDKEAAKHI